MNLDALKSLGAAIAKAGGPIIGAAVGGPLGSTIGGAVVDALAEALGVPATPEAVQTKIEASPAAAGPAVRELEQNAAELIPLWTAEADRAAQAQTAELEQGFGSWAFWKGAWQAVILLGWVAILVVSLVGGNLGVLSAAPLKDVIETWGSVTLVWFAVYNGGHTLKAIVPSLGFGRRF